MQVTHQPLLKDPRLAMLLGVQSCTYKDDHSKDDFNQAMILKIVTRLVWKNLLNAVICVGTSRSYPFTFVFIMRSWYDTIDSAHMMYIMHYLLCMPN